MQVVAVRTVVDVTWQDGMVEEGMPSVALVAVPHGDEHDFLTGDFVELRDPFDDAPAPVCSRATRF